MSSINVACFARVSKRTQEVDRQVFDLAGAASRMSWEVVATFTEKVSGSTKNLKRPELQKLLELARSGVIDKVLVTEVSRLGRRTSEVLQIIEELTDLGVSIYVHGYGLETLTGDGKRNPIAQLMFTMLAEFARLEKEMLVERINSGLDEARRKGKHIGRAAGSVKSLDQLLKDHADVVRQLRAGKSIRDVAAITGKSEGTVKKVKKALVGPTSTTSE